MHKATLRFLTLSLVFFFLVIGITILFYYTLHPLTKQTIPLDIFVGDYTGINLDSDAIHFGTVQPGSLAQRSVYLYAGSYDSEIALIVDGISFIFPENKTLYLHKGEGEAVRLFAATNANTPKKKYEGTLTILTKKI
ncbi:MAG TPA: hypothetical protein VJH37_02410 [Candidatus Nanoarchaeia archaeon]|nr:hypothetical protein [Candidatus Nanoarchaeia archaeon]